jgi:predicted PurR-regulated permease PerM
MADQDVNDTPDNPATPPEGAGTTDEGTPSGVKVNVNDNVTLARKAGWWGILIIYGVLFLTTGFMAFYARDVNPALQQGLQNVTSQMSNDTETKTVMLNMIQQEANEHNKKQSLALQSFNVVLGSLLGFLSASAVSKVSGGGDHS